MTMQNGQATATVFAPVAIASSMRERHPDVAGIESDVHEYLSEMRTLGVLQRGA